MKRLFAQVASAAFFIAPALAEPQYPTTPPAPPPPPVVILDPATGQPLFTSSNPGNVSGTFSASFSGFQPTPAYAALAVGASSTRVALPAGTVVIVYNTGANAASVTLGSGSVVATGANDIIQSNSWVAFTVGANVDLAGIEATGAAGTTSLVISGGSGLPTGAGGGGGGSSGGTAATFTPDNSFSTPLAVTSTTANTALPASATTGSVVKVYNRGPSQIFYQLGTSGVTATTSNAILAPNSMASVIVKAGQTNIAALTVATPLTATLNVESGTGLPQDTGGPANASVFQTTGLASVSWTNIGATDNSVHTVPIQATAPGTAATTALLGIQGSASGVPIPISGSVTASFSQFAPNGNYSTPLVVGAASARVALPSGGGSTVGVYNIGANAAFVRLGTVSVVATGVEDQVAPGGFQCFAVGANVDIAAIETSGATTLNVSGGSGGCAGSGGGGGGSSYPGTAGVATGGTASGAGTTMPYVNVTLAGNTSANPIFMRPANIEATNVALSGANSIGITGQVFSAKTAKIAITSATSTVIAAGTSGELTYVSEWDYVSTATGQWAEGTGTNCGTGQTLLTGVYPGASPSQTGVSVPGGGAIITQVAGDDLCLLTVTATAYNGGISYNQK